jgi:hypothetical protein
MMRVTRWGEFSPTCVLGECVHWTVFKKYRSRVNFWGYFFFGKSDVFILTKMGWATHIFGRLFHKLIRSPWRRGPGYAGGGGAAEARGQSDGENKRKSKDPGFAPPSYLGNLYRKYYACDFFAEKVFGTKNLAGI